MVCRTELSLNQEREILAKQHGTEECACGFLEGLVCLYPGQEKSGLSYQGFPRWLNQSSMGQSIKKLSMA